MPAVQTTYPENIGLATVGQVANTANYDADSYIVETAAGIGFGLAAQQGAKDNTVKLGIAANTFVGVTVKDPTRDPADSDKYADESVAAMCYDGDIWVSPTTAVDAGDRVTAKTTTGALGNTAPAANAQILIAGARWMTSSAANGLAVLRLSGELPGAA